MSTKVFIGIAFGLLSMGSAYALTTAHSLVADAPDLNPSIVAPSLPQNTIQTKESRPIQEKSDMSLAPVVASLTPDVDLDIQTQAEQFDAIETSRRPPARVISQQSVETVPRPQNNQRISKIGELWAIGVFR